ncbi:hypothetical protein ColTof4_00902 [Colletotrichum tofieldiae]|nr:hypothetical protein ColTof3_08122 [Colletotrichum tofieldiae]GKT68479.1 hypothetical protein ColTof4_00902 [Colletotrichum tofieldiae]
MERFNNRIRQYLAALIRITSVKREKPKHNTNDDCCSQAYTAPEHKSTAAKKGWEYCPNAEFPWRLEQVVDKEENWRGTWVLEVKDLQAMDWGTICVPKAKADGNRQGGRYQRQPTRHLPFLADGGDSYRETLPGGQDDLMVQLGKR